MNISQKFEDEEYEVIQFKKEDSMNQIEQNSYKINSATDEQYELIYEKIDFQQDLTSSVIKEYPSQEIKKENQIKLYDTFDFPKENNIRVHDQQEIHSENKQNLLPNIKFSETDQNNVPLNKEQSDSQNKFDKEFIILESIPIQRIQTLEKQSQQQISINNQNTLKPDTVIETIERKPQKCFLNRYSDVQIFIFQTIIYILLCFIRFLLWR